MADEDFDPNYNPELDPKNSQSSQFDYHGSWNGDWQMAVGKLAADLGEGYITQEEIQVRLDDSASWPEANNANVYQYYKEQGGNMKDIVVPINFQGERQHSNHQQGGRTHGNTVPSAAPPPHVQPHPNSEHSTAAPAQPAPAQGGGGNGVPQLIVHQKGSRKVSVADAGVEMCFANNVKPADVSALASCMASAHNGQAYDACMNTPIMNNQVECPKR